MYVGFILVFPSWNKLNVQEKLSTKLEFGNWSDSFQPLVVIAFKNSHYILKINISAIHLQIKDFKLFTNVLPGVILPVNTFKKNNITLNCYSTYFWEQCENLLKIMS